jgi:hypothetical protein
MGEISEMILDGILDEETGEYLGEGCGYPRSLRRELKSFKGGNYNENQAVFGLMNYMVRNYPSMSKSEKRGYVKEYSEEKLGLKYEVLGFNKCCVEIQKNFNAFTQFVKNKQKS